MMTMTCLPAAASIERRLDTAANSSPAPRASGSTCIPPAASQSLYGRWPHAGLFAAFNKQTPSVKGAKFIFLSTTPKERPFVLRDLNRLCPFRAWDILAYVHIDDLAATLAKGGPTCTTSSMVSRRTAGFAPPT